MNPLSETSKVKTMVGLVTLYALTAVFAMPTNAYALFPAKNVPIVLYHKVDERTPSTYWVSLHNFRDQAFFLQDQGYTSVDFDDLYDHVKGIRELPAKPVIISCDDGYDNVYAHAMPLLAERGLFGVSSAGPTNYFGDSEPNRLSNTWDIAAEYYCPQLIWPEVTALYNGGWSIAAHGQLHKALASMTTAERAGEVASRHVLATKAGIPTPNFYVYPFGSSDATLIAALKADGYLGARNASGGIETTTRLEGDPNQLFYIRCSAVNKADTLATFAGYVGGTVPSNKPTLTVSTVGNGSVVQNPDQPYYTVGTVVNLTAVPDPGYTFSSWSGDLTGSTNPTTITMNANKSVTATFALANTLPFFDGFESGGTTHGGWTAPTGATASTTLTSTGTYSLRLTGNTSTTITKAQSTVGYNTIHVKYDRHFVVSSNVTLFVDWSTDGTNWNTLETVSDASESQYAAWISKDFTCASGADNNAGFRIRFRITAGTSGYVYIDNVEITPPVAPSPAATPIPENSAVNQGLNMDLYWTAGRGATSHDVYFGTAASPPFIGNQTGTIFDTGTLSLNTTYYWRIDEKNASGTTTGTVWSFTTDTGKASKPNPANLATGVSITADLSWTAGPTATSHDVYFGTSSPGTFQGNQTGTTFDPGTLLPNTTYYWCIDEHNEGGTVTGDVWSFTTGDIITFVAAGAAVSGTGAVSPVWPTHQANDIGIMVIETGGEGTTLTPSGWTHITGSPVIDVESTAGSKLNILWKRAASSSEASVSTGDSGDHQVARIYTFRGVIETGDPWNVVATGAKTTASTTATAVSVTTTVADTLVLLIVGRPNDSSSTAHFGEFTNANLTNITERGEAGTTQGHGGGFVLTTGVKATTGATGTSTSTKIASTTDTYMTIALKPIVTYGISGCILDLNDVPIDGVLVSADNGGGLDTTDPNGYYEVWVSYNWSGTVTPTDEEYTFAPANRPYSNVLADQTYQDYVGTSIYDLYPDGIIDLLDLDVLCENWLTTGPGDFDNDGTVDFRDFAEFANVW